MKTTSAGSLDRITPARPTEMLPVARLPWSVTRPRGRVKFCSLMVRTSGRKNSFQWKLKARIPTIRHAGDRQGDVDRTEDPPRPGTVKGGCFGEVVRQAKEVLAHQEGAECYGNGWQDQGQQGVGQAHSTDQHEHRA